MPLLALAIGIGLLVLVVERQRVVTGSQSPGRPYAGPRPVPRVSANVLTLFPKGQLAPRPSYLPPLASAVGDAVFFAAPTALEGDANKDDPHCPEFPDASGNPAPTWLVRPGCNTMRDYRNQRWRERLQFADHIEDGARVLLLDDDRWDWQEIPPVDMTGVIYVGHGRPLDPNGNPNGDKPGGGPASGITLLEEQENKDLFYKHIVQTGGRIPLSWVDAMDIQDAVRLLSGNVATIAPSIDPTEVFAQGGAESAASSRAFRKNCRTRLERNFDTDNERKQDATAAVAYIAYVVTTIIKLFYPQLGTAVATIFQQGVIDPIKLSEVIQQVPADQRAQLQALIGDVSPVYYTSTGIPFRRRPGLFRNGPGGIGWTVTWLNLESRCGEPDLDDKFDQAAGQAVAGGAIGTANLRARKTAMYCATMLRALDMLACIWWPNEEQYTDDQGRTVVGAPKGCYSYVNPMYGAIAGSIFPPTSEDITIAPRVIATPQRVSAGVIGFSDNQATQASGHPVTLLRRF